MKNCMNINWNHEDTSVHYANKVNVNKTFSQVMFKYYISVGTVRHKFNNV